VALSSTCGYLSLGPQEASCNLVYMPPLCSLFDTDSLLRSPDWTGTLEEGEIIFVPAQEVVDPETGLTSTAIIGEVVVCN